MCVCVCLLRTHPEEQVEEEEQVLDAFTHSHVAPSQSAPRCGLKLPAERKQEGEMQQPRPPTRPALPVPAHSGYLLIGRLPPALNTCDLFVVTSSYYESLVSSRSPAPRRLSPRKRDISSKRRSFTDGFLFIYLCSFTLKGPSGDQSCKLRFNKAIDRPSSMTSPLYVLSRFLQSYSAPSGTSSGHTQDVLVVKTHLNEHGGCFIHSFTDFSAPSS